MWLENVQNLPENDQNWPKNVENKANGPRNIPKVCKLLKRSYLWQKVRDLPSKSYCWSPILLRTLCLGATTISSSGPVFSSRVLFGHTLSSVWSWMVLNDVSVLLVVFLNVLAKSWFVLIYSHKWSIFVLECHLLFFIDLYCLAWSKLQIQGLDKSETLNAFWPPPSIHNF